MSEQKSKPLADVFRNPGPEYSLIPFWFLNDRVDRAKLIRQLDDFQAKGIDGFVIHPRMGLPENYEYLGKEFLADVRFLVEEAHRRNMKAVLYDEGMYPSGSAHGMVVAGNPEYAARALRLESADASRPALPALQAGERIEAAFYAEGEGPLSGCKVHELNLKTPLPAGRGRLLFLISTFSHGTIRGIHFGEDDGEAGAPPAADLLNPQSVKKFLHVTYDQYFEAVGEYFGSTVIAMFTDEPSLLGRCVNEKLLKPWTEGFLPFYESLGNRKEDLLALWFDVGNETQIKRNRFQKAVEIRLEETYYRQLSEWCAAHGIALTGHPAKSCDIGAERYFQIPGQDVVWRCIHPGKGGGVDGPDSVLGKCSSDSARHRGRRRNADECFGCCGPDGRQWEFTADDMKWYMDWLFARGVNLLYPHAFLYSARGEKRLGERPPDVGPNNLWWKHYRIFSDYAKRMCWLNTDSVNHASIAVLCTADSMPWQIVRPLWQNQYEFNYLEESLLGNKCRRKGDCLVIGKQSYRAAVVEEPERLSRQAAQFLCEFSRAGGLLILFGDSLPDAEHAIQIQKPEDLPSILEKAVPKAVEIPNCPDLRVSTFIKAGEEFFLLVNEGENEIRGEAVLHASGYPEMWDAMDGSRTPLPFSRDGNGVRIVLRLPRRGSAVIRMSREALPIPERTEPVPAGNVDLSGGWTLRINGRETAVPALASWTKTGALRRFSGEGVYERQTEIEIPAGVKKAVLDLGSVHDLAEVSINGKNAGVRLWAPYRFDVTREAGRKITGLKITVTNSIANRLADASLDSGLLGPVTLRLYR